MIRHLPADAVPLCPTEVFISTHPGLTTAAYEELLPLVQPAGTACVADVLRAVRAAVLERSPDYDLRELDLYADASAEFGSCITAFLGFGAEAAAFRRAQGGVLKFTHVPFEPEHGKRTIDVPYSDLKLHVVAQPGCGDAFIYSYVQRELEIVRDWDAMRRAMIDFRESGYALTDIKFGNVGRDPQTGKMLLCDYWGAVPLGVS